MSSQRPSQRSVTPRDAASRAVPGSLQFPGGLTTLGLHLRGAGQVVAERRAKTAAGVARLHGLLEQDRDHHDEAIPIGRSYHREFSRAYSEWQKEDELRQLEAMFRMIDTDGSRTISFAEFSACVSNPSSFKILNRRFGFQCHDALRIFRALDTNGSGQISVEEWMTTCKFLMDQCNDGNVVTDWSLRAHWRPKRTAAAKQPSHGVPELSHSYVFQSPSPRR